MSHPCTQTPLTQFPPLHLHPLLPPLPQHLHLHLHPLPLHLHPAEKSPLQLIPEINGVFESNAVTGGGGEGEGVPILEMAFSSAAIRSDSMTTFVDEEAVESCHTTIWVGVFVAGTEKVNILYWLTIHHKKSTFIIRPYKITVKY